ncbi:CRISPR-associated endonuclease Cas6 [Methanosphaerula subterraneus]|uniref:CRISPR-associated endonuclease Cas6 n=1 Tax=Methanosphaerula subterraneus TaxID=3350244 RepID=UPI003F8553E3
MNLQIFTLTLSPPGPNADAARDLLRYLSAAVNEYTQARPERAIHQYPVVQYRVVDGVPTVIGINEGAAVLADLGETIVAGGATYPVQGRDASVREEAFGIAEEMLSYEFVTPWIALNQEQARTFYTLKGKDRRDGFVQKILVKQIGSLARAVGYTIPGPVTVASNLHFQKSRLDGAGVILFTGTFSVNFVIPDLLGLGRSVPAGFGGMRRRAVTGE